MRNESRTRKTFLNARINLIFYFLTLALSFFSRKIFLNILGIDFIGLTGTLQSLLNFLNIAELGIGTAVGYTLYKPLFEQNQHQINEIISVFGYMYRWIGKIILIIGIILSFFLPLIFPQSPFNLSIIYLIYYVFLLSSLIGYFINYKQTLLSADQRNYVITAYFQTANIVKTILQMISAFYIGSYYLWIIIEFVFAIIHSLILNWKINKVYPWLKSNVSNGKTLLKKYPNIIQLSQQVFVHKIGGIAQFQLTPFLVYAFTSLQAVALYGNYALISDKLNALLNSLLNSTAAGIGNLIAEGSTEKILKIYWELMAVRFFFAGLFVFSMYYLLPPFIALWLGSNYLLPQDIMICILCIFALGIIRGTTEQFIAGHGLYQDTWAPITETFIYLLVALSGGYWIGLKGILLGNIASLLIIIYGWKPYFLFKRGFKLPIKVYWKRFLQYIFILVLSFVIIHIIHSYIHWEYGYNDWYSFLGYCLYIAISITLVLFFMMYIGTEGMRNFIKRFYCYESFSTNT